MFKRYSLLSVWFLLTLIFIPDASKQQIKSQEGTYFQVRIIEPGRLGIENPTGLAFDPVVRCLIINNSTIDTTSGAISTDLDSIRLYEENLANSSPLSQISFTPANMIFDERSRKLYIINNSADEMLLVDTLQNNNLNTSSQGVIQYSL